LDGVRAFAVLAVMLFHGGVAALPGGFLGVDAFFVLSGFLITSLLLAERARTGRTNLVAFWGRRVRRLLPALLLLLATVAVVSRWVLAPTELPALRFDELAAVAYVANWRMMLRGGDYFAATGAPSPLQHTWSLGIEEQFYLVWPLLFVLAAGLAARHRGAAAPRTRAILLAVCAAGAVASAVTAAVLYAPLDVDRVYYGTDSRAVALLVGCILGLLLDGQPARVRKGPYPSLRDVEGALPHAGPSTARRHRLLGGLALAGAAATVALWVTAHGGDPWLYRGGLTLVALATAAVIAHAVVSPGSPTARLLALPPLVAVGEISYGLYLWHWPVFGWLSADRTGLSGAALLGLRFLAVFAAATLSYLLVERPIRTARWPRVRPRLGASAAVAAAAATAMAAVLLTVPPAQPPAPAVALPAAPAPSAASTTAPIHRPGRTPGALPRIAFMGDSVSWSLGTYLPAQSQLQVSVRGVPGCGIARLPDIRYLDAPHTNYPGCDRWDARWRRDIAADDPDVAVILLDRWELMDRRLNGTYQHVGEPGYDAYLRRELDLAIDIVGARGAAVVLLTAPYTHRAERPDGGLYPEDDPARVDAWNRLLVATAAQRGATVIDLRSVVCPGGTFTWDVDGIRIRSDGLHFTPEGVQRVVAPWLLPQLAKIAVDGP